MDRVVLDFVQSGLSYAEAPLEVLEQVAIGAERLPQHIRELSRRLGGSSAAIISTCNRTELYAVADDAGSALEEMSAYITELASGLKSPHSCNHVASGDLAPYIRSKTGCDAVHHFFRVVTGLDSLAPGDHQVAGQVARSFRAISEAGIQVHPGLSRMFHMAFRTARRARRDSGLKRSQVSIPSFGVRLLERNIGDLSDCSALLVGAGETGRLTAMSLMRAGLRDMRIASRSNSSAEGLANEIGGSSVELRDIRAAMSDVDLVVACTSSPHAVISAADVASAFSARGSERVLHLLDLGLPRDIDEKSGAVTGARLYTMRDIESIRDEHRGTIARACERAEKIVADAASDFTREIELQPALRNLGEYAERVRRQELERTLSRMPHLNATDRSSLEAMTRAIVKRLLADHIQRIREGSMQ